MLFLICGGNTFDSYGCHARGANKNRALMALKFGDANAIREMREAQLARCDAGNICRLCNGHGALVADMPTFLHLAFAYAGNGGCWTCGHFIRAQMAAHGVLPAAQADKKAATMGGFRGITGKTSRPPCAKKSQTFTEWTKKFYRFLRHLTIVRNFCAHHRRLWNWRFHNYPLLPAKKPALRQFFNHNERGKLYNTLVILVYLTDAISSQFNLRRRLFVLLEGRGEAKETAMGFPSGWRTLEFWR